MSGCALISFDPSSALVATRQDDSPGTLWIWDVQAAELRAVLLFNANIASVSWHPQVPETLLIRCEGDQHNGLVFVWDPVSDGPWPVDFGQHFPAAKVGSKPRALWLGLNSPNSPPMVFFSDAHNYVLACLGEADQGHPPWGAAGAGLASGAFDPVEESPLHLVPASGSRPEAPDAGEEEEDDDDSELEDTFVHKR